MISTRIVRSVAGLSMLLGLVGCVMPDQLSRLQKDVADVQQQLRGVERNQTEALDNLARMAEKPEEEGSPVTRGELAQMTLRLEEAVRGIDINNERLTDLDRRLDRFSQELQQVRAVARQGSRAGNDLNDDEVAPLDLPGTGSRTNSSSAIPDPESLYNTAYADFSKGNFALAVSGFEEYQQRFPESALADNALYWIGECRFSEGDFSSAIRALDNMLDRYPRSDKAAAANLKKAIAFLEQNQIRQAIVQLRYVVSAYPGTDEARIARDKLTGLGTSAN